MVTSIGQTLITGALLGGLYAIFALGMSLSWALLRVINYAIFAFVFLMAYVTYELATRHGLDPLLALLITIPLGAALSIGLQAFTSAAKIDTFGSLIVTFGLFLVVQSSITLVWTNDLVRIPEQFNPYFADAWHFGAFTIPLLGVLALAVAVILCAGTYWMLNISFAGKAMRAVVQDPSMAAAFGINAGRLGYVVAAICGVAIAVTGSCLGMMYALTPSAMQTWVAVVFATVLLGGLGNPRGLLAAAMILAVISSATQRFTNPALA
ncbi:MAG TPA: branched-chain amino acid ABC transporter permease, partial [Propionibacteriaceae bacterium]